MIHIGWLWRAPVAKRGKGRGWVFRVQLEGRSYPKGTVFVPVYAEGGLPEVTDGPYPAGTLVIPT